VEQWAAHWSFIALNVLLWAVWLGLNRGPLAKELPTITGLTMWLSVQAIVMTTLVLVAQKRADEKERRRRDLEFQWASATVDRINQINDRLSALERQPRLKMGSSVERRVPGFWATRVAVPRGIRLQSVHRRGVGGRQRPCVAAADGTSCGFRRATAGRAVTQPVWAGLPPVNRRNRRRARANTPAAF
jgi:hypothetical protein